MLQDVHSAFPAVYTAGTEETGSSFKLFYEDSTIIQTANATKGYRCFALPDLVLSLMQQYL